MLLFSVFRNQPKDQPSAQMYLTLDCFYKQDLMGGSGDPVVQSGDSLELVGE